MKRILTVIVALSLATVLGCASVRTRALLKKGHDLYRAQKYEEAVAVYQEIVELDPGHWEANYRIAVSYLAMYHPGSSHPKDLDYAEKGAAALKRCLDLPPPASELDKVRNYYLGLLTSAQRTDEAIAYVEKLLADDPKNTDLVAQLADLSAKGGDFPKALSLYKRRAELLPDDKQAWYTLGVACWDRSYHGNMLMSDEERAQVVEDGLSALDRALQIDPGYFDALSYTNLLYRQKAEVLSLTGQHQEAGQALLLADQFMKKALAARQGAQQQG